VNWHRVRVVARTDLTQLLQARDFWGPMVALGTLFFAVIPTVLLLTITSIGDVATIARVSQALDLLPAQAQAALQGDTPSGRTSYALAVFLLAPIAIVVPLTIASAVGAASLVGERERGTGEFLAHSPASTGEIYLGKLIAAVLPGYVTTAVGFAAYSLIVNLTVGGEVGGWFFPTPAWWVLIAWVLPPILCLTLSIVLRLSARVRSTAAAQQAAGLVSLPMIGIAYSQATGTIVGGAAFAWALGALAWLAAGAGLWRGVAAMSRSRLLGVADGV
jgi:ABC-type transport system involved in multi-copper enzyme maturation permease subunit